MRRLFLRLAALVMLAAAASPAAAYWDYGHRAVARIAWLEMKPATRGAVAALLRDQPLLDTPTCPAGTIEDAAVWADCVKGLGDRFRYAASWHYQNVDICRPFDLAAACRDGNCVSAQIERQRRVLADRTAPRRERVMALAFLAHFVGDLHQPMHAGDRGDRGGNQVAASYGRIGGRANLHSIWDGWLAERAATTPPAGPDRLWSGTPAARRRAMRRGDVTAWSREMWDESRRHAYTTMLGDPCGPSPQARPALTEGEVQQLIPTVRRHLVMGGVRLARLLDESLAR